MSLLPTSLVRLALVSAIALAGLAVLPSAANAVPSFQRQTGLPCEACHVGGFGPQLTPAGQDFKLSGYGAASSWSKDHPNFDTELSAMLVGDYSHTTKNQPLSPAPDYRSNNNFALQEASLFAGGRLTPDLGVFGQVTYSGIDKSLSLDNVDIRYAHAFKWNGKSAVFGVSVNNNPTSQDVWNSLPAWSFPYQSPELAPQRTAAPLIAGGLEQQVVGATAYVWLNRSVYIEGGGYESPSGGVLKRLGLPQDARVDGFAPYGRAAYSGKLMKGSYSVGLFGMRSRLNSGAPGLADRYSDLGADATYQRELNGGQMFALNANYIQERTNLAASVSLGNAATSHGALNSFTTDASWRWSAYGVTLGGFKTSGLTDTSLYAPDPGGGSRTGRPDSSGATLQVDWTPQIGGKGFVISTGALRLGAQYTAYDKFNGASKNYDGFGRKASDNNTLAVFAWAAF